jgi:alpha-L-fucosidase 2
LQRCPSATAGWGPWYSAALCGERIQLNESSLWDGYPAIAANPSSAEALPEVQRLMFAGQK